MFQKNIAPSLLMARYPASLFRVNDGIILPLRMGAAALHCLAFVIWANGHGELAMYSVTAASESAVLESAIYAALKDEVRSSLAFTFMFLVLSSFIFLTGALVRFETLHFVQALFHIGGCAMLFTAQQQKLHVDRVWHSALVFNLLPLVLDLLALIYVWRRKRLWIL